MIIITKRRFINLTRDLFRTLPNPEPSPAPNLTNRAHLRVFKQGYRAAIMDIQAKLDLDFRRLFPK